jgi:hypothetical protein
LTVTAEGYWLKKLYRVSQPSQQSSNFQLQNYYLQEPENFQGLECIIYQDPRFSHLQFVDSKPEYLYLKLARLDRENLPVKGG